jgi:hypothetical protein
MKRNTYDAFGSLHMLQLARPAACNLCMIGWLQIDLSQAERMQIPPPGQETKNKSVSRGPDSHDASSAFFFSAHENELTHANQSLTQISFARVTHPTNHQDSCMP